VNKITIANSEFYGAIFWRRMALIKIHKYVVTCQKCNLVLIPRYGNFSYFVIKKQDTISSDTWVGTKCKSEMLSSWVGDGSEWQFNKTGNI